MNVAITGATGFIGQYIVRQLVEQGHRCTCWYRPDSARETLADLSGDIGWVAGALGDAEAEQALLRNADAVVHAALYRPQPAFRGAEGDITVYTQHNLVGSLRLMDAAHRRGTPRFVFISTCAVHEVILEDRALDEDHPCRPGSHYGAHKAALEMFVHSYGLRHGYGICALRPTGVYGLHHHPPMSKWFALIKQAAAGDFSAVGAGGGKEVHAGDVARAVALLLEARDVAGRAYNCYDRYVSEEQVASIAARLSGRECAIPRRNAGPRHEIETARIRGLGMTFGGTALLEKTVGQILAYGS